MLEGIEQATVQAKQQMHAQQMAVDSFIKQTSIQVYSGILQCYVESGVNIDHNVCRDTAANAVKCAPFLAEAWKMIKISDEAGGLVTEE